VERSSSKCSKVRVSTMTAFKQNLKA
jgi:hypothetical protein